MNILNEKDDDSDEESNEETNFDENLGNDHQERRGAQILKDPMQESSEEDDSEEDEYLFELVQEKY